MGAAISCFEGAQAIKIPRTDEHPSKHVHDGFAINLSTEGSCGYDSSEAHDDVVIVICQFLMVVVSPRCAAAGR